MRAKTKQPNKQHKQTKTSLCLAVVADMTNCSGVNCTNSIVGPMKINYLAMHPIWKDITHVLGPTL